MSPLVLQSHLASRELTSADTPKRKPPKPFKRKPIPLYKDKTRADPNAQPSPFEARHLVVVANAIQLVHMRGLPQYANALILTAKEIERTGAFGLPIGSVDYLPGWYLEIEKPEIIVQRIAARLTVNHSRL